MSRPNFRIIEGNKDYEEIYQKFEKLYKNTNIPKREIKEQLDIGNSKYNSLKEMFKKRNGFMRKTLSAGKCVLVQIKNNNEK